LPAKKVKKSEVYTAGKYLHGFLINKNLLGNKKVKKAQRLLSFYKRKGSMRSLSLKL
jgi:hypothetical protein